MPKIRGFKVKNYKALKNVTIGKLWNIQKAKELTSLTVVIGKNGSGKSTLFDAFGFLSDCLQRNVEWACDNRSGFEKIRTKGQKGPIEFEICYEQTSNSRPMTYELAIDLDNYSRPFVSKERLRQRRKGQRYGWPYSYLILNNGKGPVWKGDAPGKQIEEDKIQFDLFNYLKQIKNEEKETQEESKDREIVEMDDKRKLAIATIGSLKQHPRISAFRKFVESWYLSYFTPDAARSLPLAGPEPHLNKHGDNLGNVVQFMEKKYPHKFKKILKSISEKIPGVQNIATEKTQDGRLLLKFNDKGFNDPFYAQQMSDGTLKVFAYLLLLEDPQPPTFLCIEEPENGLYHKLLETLVTEFRKHAQKKKHAPQVFITTHQPYFVDALNPEEVWVLNKNNKGFAEITRASEYEIINNLVEEGLPLGGLWYSDYLKTI